MKSSALMFGSSWRGPFDHEYVYLLPFSRICVHSQLKILVYPAICNIHAFFSWCKITKWYSSLFFTWYICAHLHTMHQQVLTCFFMGLRNTVMLQLYCWEFLISVQSKTTIYLSLLYLEGGSSDEDSNVSHHTISFVIIIWSFKLHH